MGSSTHRSISPTRPPSLPSYKICYISGDRYIYRHIWRLALSTRSEPITLPDDPRSTELACFQPFPVPTSAQLIVHAPRPVVHRKLAVIIAHLLLRFLFSISFPPFFAFSGDHGGCEFQFFTRPLSRLPRPAALLLLILLLCWGAGGPGPGRRCARRCRRGAGPCWRRG